MIFWQVIGKQPSDNDPSPGGCTFSSGMDNNADVADNDLFDGDDSEYEVTSSSSHLR